VQLVNGCCSFRGDYTLENCQRFITEEDYEKKYDTDNRNTQGN
jgi:hypothetical protein